MNRRPKHDDPVVIPFRPRPKPPKVPAPWQRSLRLFSILFPLAGVLGGLTTGAWFDWTNLVFAVALAGVITFGEFQAKRR